MSPAFAHPNRGTLLWALIRPKKFFAYRTITFYREAFQLSLAKFWGLKTRPEHHINNPVAKAFSVCPNRFSFALLTGSLLISFPQPTKIFQFGWSSILSNKFGNPWFNGRVLLPKAFRSLLRPSSFLEPNHPLTGLIVATFCYLLAVNYVFSHLQRLHENPFPMESKGFGSSA